MADRFFRSRSEGMALFGEYIKPDGQWCHLHRCVFGNPFRPVTTDPSWLMARAWPRTKGIVEALGARFRTVEWPGERLPEVYYDPRSLDRDAIRRAVLHAKCVVTDRRVALVTSANVTEAAQTRNIEVGALVRCANFSTNLAAHFVVLVDLGLLRRLEFGK
jgi:phosphatidylserine/phosphatidylglycerophosphate/cardiolipin synthase-like enzyme